jgi:hypothetical protein
VRNEDKRIGPWYLEAENGAIPQEQVRNKLLFYLWHDVFRSQRTAIFARTLLTFDEVQATFDLGGIRAVLPDLIVASQPPDASAGTSAAITSVDERALSSG